MTGTGKKAHFRSEFRVFVETEKALEWGRLNEGQRTRLMTEFYVRKILAALQPTLVPTDDEEIERSITDGKDDHGVDFLWRNEGRVLIVQAKYHQKNDPIAKEEFELTRSIVSRLSRLVPGQDKVNQLLEYAIADVDWNTDRFEIHHISLGRATESLRRLEELGQDNISSLPDIDDRVGIFLNDETRLNELLRDAFEFQELIPRPVVIRLSKEQGEPAWLRYTNKSGRTCYVGRIRGNQLHELVKDYNNRLFALNIRNYLGEITTNKNIVKTARQDADSFFFYNNGISAVATDIDEDTEVGALRCTGFSIINGTQTVNSVFRAFRNDQSRAAGELDVLRTSNKN